MSDLPSGLVLVLLIVAYYQKRDRIKQSQRAELDEVIASLPPDHQASFAAEWIAEFESVPNPEMAVYFEGLRQSVRELGGDPPPARGGVGAPAHPRHSAAAGWGQRARTAGFVVLVIALLVGFNASTGSDVDPGAQVSNATAPIPIPPDGQTGTGASRAQSDRYGR